MELVFATHNPNKLGEVQAILGTEFDLKQLDDLGLVEDIPETADTLEGNARIKAVYVREHTGMDVFADDTGLEVDALDGAPGVLSARYAGPKKSAKDNIEKVLGALADAPDRTARFRTVVALLIGDREYIFEGTVEGEIVQAPCGAGGFGYDPIFKPVGYDVTFAEMDPEEKNRISHRGRAIAKLVEFLQTAAH